MKLLIISTLLILPDISKADFSIDNVRSIECSSTEPTETLNVKFTTTSRAARLYTRRTNQIPYSYDNDILKMRAFASGVLSYHGTEGDRIILVDGWETKDAVTLVLTHKVKSLYTGTLSGMIENVENEWVPLIEHPLDCVIRFN
jgi:hypothetical protein